MTFVTFLFNGNYLLLGGPGSNKGYLCQKAVRQVPGWAHISVGRLLRAATDANDFNANDTFVLKQAISAGELVPQVNYEI